MSPGSTPSPFDRVEDVIQDISEGKLVIVTDDEDRENEGDLIMAAAKATPEAINMMIRYGSGIVCVPMLEHQLRRFGLGPMVARNRESQRTDFTVSVDAAEGISTGISAYDRTRTIRILADDASRPEQLVQPGHVFPLRARNGGVLERAGHTEAAVDLAILAGLPPAGVICELVNDDGTVQRLPRSEEASQRMAVGSMRHCPSTGQICGTPWARPRPSNCVSLALARRSWSGCWSSQTPCRQRIG